MRMSEKYFSHVQLICEPPHGNKVTCAPSADRSAWASAKADLSALGARRNLGSLTTHPGHSEYCSDWADTHTDLTLHWAPSHVVGFIMRSLIYKCLRIA